MYKGGCFYDEKKNVLGTIGFEFTIKTPVKCAYYCVNFAVTRLPYGSPVIATLSEPDTYSPYHEQLLTLPTPTGLPGIPVTSGGNYTDQSGQQWVCDEVDLEKGVKVQRVNAYKLIEVETLQSINSYGIANFIAQRKFSDAFTSNNQKLFLVNRFAPQNSLIANTPKEGMLINASGLCFLRIKQETANTVDGMNAWLSRNDVLVYYALAAPIETPLAPAELAAYGPDTVVQASDGAGVKLVYQRDVNLVVKNLEDAIASMTNT